MSDDLPELVVRDAAAWRRWLTKHHAQPAGVWLVLAKKGVTDPTSLSYDQALDEALCHGWIDGQVARRDATTYRQRFTRRRARSMWSEHNVRRIQRLSEAGVMRAAGIAEVERAKADGRWERAYAGGASAVIPSDLETAIRANPKAARTFASLNAQNRYALIFRVNDAKRDETRARRVAQFVAMLAAGDMPHPQATVRAAGRRVSTSDRS